MVLSPSTMSHKQVQSYILIHEKITLQIIKILGETFCQVSIAACSGNVLQELLALNSLRRGVNPKANICGCFMRAQTKRKASSRHLQASFGPRTTDPSIFCMRKDCWTLWASWLAARKPSQLPQLEHNYLSILPLPGSFSCMKYP